MLCWICGHGECFWCVRENVVRAHRGTRISRLRGASATRNSDLSNKCFKLKRTGLVASAAGVAFLPLLSPHPGPVLPLFLLSTFPPFFSSGDGSPLGPTHCFDTSNLSVCEPHRDTDLTHAHTLSPCFGPGVSYPTKSRPRGGLPMCGFPLTPDVKGSGLSHWTGTNQARITKMRILHSCRQCRRAPRMWSSMIS